MGTSVSQSSPATTSWRSVAACYRSDQVSTERIASEVWRAATAGAGSLEAHSDRMQYSSAMCSHKKGYLLNVFMVLSRSLRTATGTRW